MKISGDHFSIEIESGTLGTQELIRLASEVMDRKVLTGKWDEPTEVNDVV